MYELFLSITKIVDSLGYIGIFIMTFIEGSLIPVPSEFTLIPAGYLAAKGSFNIIALLISSIIGTLAGVLFSYYIAYKFGRRLLLKYGKYVFIDHHRIELIESFFRKHGPISTFTGRMMPGVKHFIAFPAGLGKMDFKLFFIYSAAGCAVWVSLILAVGYFIGDNEELIYQYLQYLNIIIIGSVVMMIAFYLFRRFNSQKDEE